MRHVGKSAVLIFLIAISFTNGQSLENYYRNSSHKLLDTLTNGVLTGKAWDWLAEICDDYGHRLVGSDALERVIDHIVGQLKEDGFDNVHTEPVTGIPHFVRGDDRVTLIEPRKLDLNILAIPGAKAGKVEAEAVVLTEWEQLDNVNVSGKIVVFVQKWNGYGKTVKYRSGGVDVAKRGAVGLLVKSITPFSLGNVHTGQGGKEVPIPCASLSLEEAEMLLRLSRRGKKLSIEMDIRSMTLPDTVISRNTIFDIRGYQYPNEIVLISGHLDSWDIGQGALDDGGGCAAVYFAMKAIKYLSEIDVRFRPKRTIRGVFWTAEESGMQGAHQYYDDHGRNTFFEKFFFVSETDQGAFRPKTYNSALDFKGTETQMSQMGEMAAILNSYGIPLVVRQSAVQGDVSQFANDGIPSSQYTSDRGPDFYFYFHHSNADYMNVLEKKDIDYVAGIFAVLAHVISNMAEWH